MPAAQTPLSRALDGEESTRPTPLDALDVARRRFLAGQRVDMSAVADELGVSRVTLYRWVGDRAALLGEVMASLAIRTLEKESARIRARGSNRIAHLAAHIVQSLMANPGMQALLAAEPQFALRLLTTSEGNVQQRIMDWWDRELTKEIQAGHMAGPLPSRDLAYLIVRLCESFVYKEVIVGEAADPTQAAVLFHMVLPH
jgi:AcrR family transcriptional regulator